MDVDTRTHSTRCFVKFEDKFSYASHMVSVYAQMRHCENIF